MSKQAAQRAPAAAPRKPGPRLALLVVAATSVLGIAHGRGAANERSEKPAKPAATSRSAGAADSLESSAILAREPRTERSEVLHVLIGWAELEPAYGGKMDERGKSRSREAAVQLALDVLEKARQKEAFTTLMREHSEDWASAANGTRYTASPDAALVEPFKNLALRLDVDEVGLVESAYGFHIMKRVK